MVEGGRCRSLPHMVSYEMDPMCGHGYCAYSWCHLVIN
jgi:hypothetical protein